MAAQLPSIGLALLIFPLFIWVPGAALAYSANLLEFRRRTVPTQLALGLLLSMSCLPIVTYLLARGAGFHAVWALLGAVSAVAIGLAVRQWRQLISLLRDLFFNHRGTVLFIASFMVLVAVFEADWVSAKGVQPNLSAMDATAHVAIVDAITRSGLPPANPFVYPGHPVELLYYYGWYLICSLVDQLGGASVTARSAVQAAKIYVGLSVVAVIVSYLEVCGARLLPGIKRIQGTVGVALLMITGLDLLPWTFLYLIQRIRRQDTGWMLSLEWWNDPVPAWVGQILMSPHHSAGLVMCLTGLLLLMGIWTQPSRQALMMVLAALAFASAATTSVYVTMTFAAGLFLWLLFAAAHRWWDDVLRICLVGAAAAVLYFPMIRDLAAASKTPGLPIAFAFRDFYPVDGWLPSLIPSLKGSRLLYVLRVLFLPVNYFLELGFFAVAAVVFWRWRRSLREPLTREESLLACLALGSVLICTFLRSTIRHNDLGWRGFLVAQFVLLLWAVPVAQAMLEKARPGAPKSSSILRWPLLLWFCLVLGLAGSMFELFNFRTKFQGPQGPSTIGARDAYVWVDQHTSPKTVVLFNPDQDQEYFNALYGHRQAMVDGRIYAFLYGGISKNDSEVLKDALALFAQGTNIDEVEKTSNRYHVGAIVVLSSDPVWSDSSSWVWKMNPAFATDSSRVYVLSVPSASE